jgi:UDP:flavonoid glycosyltransferase YjiC (YdhE family)
MNITILTQGSRGDVQPYVALGASLKKTGYHVLMPATEVFRRLITEAELEYVPVHGFDPQEFIRDPEMQAAARRGGQLKILVSLLRKAGTLLEGMFDEYWRVSNNADVLIASTLVFGIADCAEKRAIPCIPAPIHALYTPTRAFPTPFFAPFGARENHFANPATYRVIQSVFGIMFRAALNRWRLKMGLPRVGNYFRYVQDRSPIILYGFSPSVLPIPGDWPPNHHVCGYWFLDEPPGWEAPPALLKFLESGPPPVYVGFGSMDTGDPQRVTRLVVEALEASGQRGVLGTGWNSLGGESLPATVFPIETIPHSWLFPKMKAVVHHGGMGTTAAGLRAGVPTIITPLGGDQSFWADRVQRLGVGLRSEGYFKVTAERLAADIRYVMTDNAIRQNAATLGAKIHAEDGVERAARLIRQTLKG